MNVLVVNTGSTSLKLKVVDPSGQVVGDANLPPPRARLDVGPIERFLGAAPDLGAVGHRVVHGGSEFRDATVLDERAMRRLEALRELAPLHNGPALEVMASLRRLRPDVPHVACFDTAFHSTMTDDAALYALPAEWIDRFGLRRYGFHGISHAWASRRAAELLDRAPEALRVVTAHLGGGASLAAVAGGRSLDTTMGFTPNEGLVMATRSGSVDPGLLLWLLREAGLSADELESALEHESGLRGLSGTSGDMREVVEAAVTDDRARTAIGVYVHRLRAGIAAMAAALGGVDCLVFTGGVGENSAAVRSAACEGLGFLGVALDAEANEAARGEDAEISAAGADPSVLVVRSREELEIARSVRSILGLGPPPSPRRQAAP